MTCPGNPVDWDESVLSLGKMETTAETEKRHEALDRQHRQWHVDTPHYISACYINMRTSDLDLKNVQYGSISATKLVSGAIRFSE